MVDYLTTLLRRPSAPAALRRRWFFITAVTLVAWGAGYGWLQGRWPYAGRWALLAAPVLAYQLWFLWRHLADNRREGQTAVLPHLGPGNWLSISRALLLGLLAGFLFAPWPRGALGWLPALLYTTAALTDIMDGMAARRADHVTVLGGKLDMAYDGIGMLVAVGLAVGYGQVPGWFVLVGLARYLFVGGLWLRRRWGWPIHKLPPSVHRRLFAGLQMGFMMVMLWPFLPAAGTRLAATVFAVPFLLGFLRDWLVVSGRIDPDSKQYRQVQGAVFRATAVYLPPLLRLTILGMVIVAFANRYRAFPPPDWVNLLVGWGLPGTVLAGTAVGLALLGTLAITLGVLPRVATWPLFLVLAFDIQARGLDLLNGALLVCGLLVLLLGPGRGALWPVEERLFKARPGTVATT